MAFKDIVGHDRQKSMLQGLIRGQRIPSSLLFKGDEGVGKRLTAVNFIKAINCNNQSDSDCCDRCQSCRRFDALIHPDLYLLEEEEAEIKIDRIRELDSFIYTKPLEVKKKAVIIDDAHKMNLNAQNAFLKTLEEPPPDCLLILISSMPDLLLDTIRSRCLQLAFNRLSKVDFSRLLGMRADQSPIEGLYVGSPGAVLSERPKKELQDFVDALEDMREGITKERWKDTEQMKVWLGLALVYLRDATVSRLVGEERYQLLNLPYKGQANLEGLLRAYDAFLELYAKSDNNLNKRIVWNLSMRLLDLPNP